MNPYESPPVISETNNPGGITGIPGSGHLRVLRSIFSVHVAIVAISLAFELIVVQSNPPTIRTVSVLVEFAVTLFFAVSVIIAASVESALVFDMRLRAVILDVTFTVIHVWMLLALLN